LVLSPNFQGGNACFAPPCGRPCYTTDLNGTQPFVHHPKVCRRFIWVGRRNIIFFAETELSHISTEDSIE